MGPYTLFEGTESDSGGGPEQSIHGSRRPVLFNSQNNSLYVGAPGAYHADLEHEFGADYFYEPGWSWGGIRDHPEGDYLMWYHPPSDEEHLAIAKQLGVSPNQPEDPWGWESSTKATHKHYTRGTPCNCGFTKHLSRSPAQLQDPERYGKTSAKMDWLRQRREKGDEFLNGPAFDQLEALNDAYKGIDPLLPWIAREVKKGRIKFSWDGSGHPTLDVEDADHPFWAGLNRQAVEHLIRWFNSKHETRKGQDIMQLSAGNVMNRVDKFLDDEELEKAKKFGQVVHEFPEDKWTIRRIQNAEEAEHEGEQMGHCVGGYGHDIEHGNTLIYSLRDHKNEPHATIEIEPNQYENKPWLPLALEHDPVVSNSPQAKEGLRKYQYFMESYRGGPIPEDILEWQGLYNQLQSKYQRKARDPLPEGGQVVQIQGKENRQPIPEYKQRLKDWFRHGFADEDRPTYGNPDEDDFYNHPDDIPDEADSVENEYGLQRGTMPEVDWPAMVRNVGEPASWRGGWVTDHAEKVYALAREHGEIPTVGKELERWEPEARERAYEGMMWNGQDYSPSWTEPDWHDYGEENREAYEKDLERWDEERQRNMDEAFDEEWGNSDQGEQLNQLYGLLAPHFYNGKWNHWAQTNAEKGTFGSIMAANEQLQLDFGEPPGLKIRRSRQRLPESEMAIPWRQPTVYDSQNGILFVGPRGAYHRDIGREFGLNVGNWADSYDGLITGYLNGQAKDYGRNPAYPQIGWFKHNPDHDYIARKLGIDPDDVDNPEEDGGWDEHWSKTSNTLWKPGNWGKGMVVDGRLHTWPTWYKGAAPFHEDILKELGVGKKNRKKRVRNPVWISPEGKAEASPTWGPQYWDERLNSEIMRQDPNITSVTDEDPYDNLTDQNQAWQEEWNDRVDEPGYDERGMPNWVKQFGIDK